MENYVFITENYEEIVVPKKYVKNVRIKKENNKIRDLRILLCDEILKMDYVNPLNEAKNLFSRLAQRDTTGIIFPDGSQIEIPYSDEEKGISNLFEKIYIDNNGILIQVSC